MKIKIYSKVEIEFLVKNYPKFGTKYCSKELNRSENSIRKKCFQLKLKVDKYGKIERFKKSFPIKNNNQYSVNPEQFFNITTPEISYIL